MPDAWWELRVQVPAGLADDAGALLVDNSGALGVQLVEGRSTTTLCAPYDRTRTAAAVRDAALAALAAAGLAIAPSSVDINSRDGDDWAHTWKEHFCAMPLGERLWVVPSWRQADALPDGALPIHLDPGMAFGTGQHATTQLCGRLIEELAPSLPTSASLLDVGCGSGILAIAGARLGLCGIVAIDNDPVAVEVARHNVKRNGVWDEVHVTSQPVEDLGARFAMVVANILAGELIRLSEILIARTRPAGHLVLSGILDTEAGEVTAAYDAAAKQAGRHGWRFVKAATQGEWVALAGGMPGPALRRSCRVV